MTAANGQLDTDLTAWASDIGCPIPSQKVIQALARGKASHFLRLLIDHVRPVDTVAHIDNILRLHGGLNPELLSQKKVSLVL
jgi:hypothetical protein